MNWKNMNMCNNKKIDIEKLITKKIIKSVCKVSLVNLDFS